MAAWENHQHGHHLVSWVPAFFSANHASEVILFRKYVAIEGKIEVLRANIMQLLSFAQMQSLCISPSITLVIDSNTQRKHWTDVDTKMGTKRPKLSEKPSPSRTNQFARSGTVAKPV
jgi:hypothetical protein